MLWQMTSVLFSCVFVLFSAQCFRPSIIRACKLQDGPGFARGGNTTIWDLPDVGLQQDAIDSQGKWVRLFVSFDLRWPSTDMAKEWHITGVLTSEDVVFNGVLCSHNRHTVTNCKLYNICCCCFANIMCRGVSDYKHITSVHSTVCIKMQPAMPVIPGPMSDCIEMVYTDRNIRFHICCHKDHATYRTQQNLADCHGGVGDKLQSSLVQYLKPY